MEAFCRNNFLQEISEEEEEEEDVAPHSRKCQNTPEALCTTQSHY